METEQNSLLELRVTAPGKLILFGEHSVVYGKTALAAGLKLRSRLILRELPHAEAAEAQFEMPGVGLSIRLPVARLQDDLFIINDDDNSDADDPRLLERARELAREYCCCQAGADQQQQQQKLRSLECALYALARVARAEGLCRLPAAANGFLLELTTELPLGAGLGSSASFSVCLAAGFLMWARIRASDGTGMAFKQTDSKTLRQISRHALGCERIMHGAPSGVDNEVCTYGSAIEFRRGQEPRTLPLSAELRVLLVDTRVARSTRLLVDKLSQLHAQYPQVFDSIFEAMDQVCRRAIDIITTTTNSSTNSQLSNLIDINMGLLTACQVSHPSIDSICATAKKHGLSAKLTGAGGGGFVYILIPPEMQQQQSSSIKELHSDLTANGFSVIETKFGGSGLDISYDFC